MRKPGADPYVVCVLGCPFVVRHICGPMPLANCGQVDSSRNSNAHEGLMTLLRQQLYVAALCGGELTN